MLRSYKTNPKISAIVNVGCCYQLLSSDGFPMVSKYLSGFQEALLLKGLKIVLKDHGNAPFVSFDVISLSRMCRMDPV
jgi:hypothetical protein